MSSSTTKFSRFQLPGLNLPITWTPHGVEHVYVDGSNKWITTSAKGEGHNLFPTALGDGESDVRTQGFGTLRLTTLREFTMLHIMNALTDKLGWEEKVFDETIAKRWKAEALATEGRDVSQKMVDWVIEELRYKAHIFTNVGAVSVFNGDVVKSDIAIPESIKQSLKASVEILENIPERHKDYHPGSDRMVLDLVHPSLFPLVYGRSRVLTDTLINLDNCIESCGKGPVIPMRPGEVGPLYSENFQWLPCDVEFSEGDSGVKIISYINNLHPKKHQDLYATIEQVISRAIPLWNMTLAPLKSKNWPISRIEYSKVSYDPDPGNYPEAELPQKLESESDNEYWRRRDDWEQDIRRVVQPEPEEFESPLAEGDAKHERHEDGTSKVNAGNTFDIRRDYGHRGLQVIVKLANIELTPEKPEYGGGVWHVEGQMNEHICATALYYYDCDNITPSRLAFRQRCTCDTIYEISYAQDHHDWLSAVFGCRQHGPAVQEVGSILCKEDRLVTFPNILQHRVLPFKLADPERKGHRKILALFLVDPGIRVISTGNVPPQQKEWWSEEVVRTEAEAGSAMGKLSVELQDKVFDEVDDFPIGIEEAKEIRLRLMAERSSLQVVHGKNFESVTFSLCEH